MTTKLFLLEFEVESHGCLVEGLARITTKIEGEGVQLEVSNLDVHPGNDHPLLLFYLTVPGDEIQAAKNSGTAWLKTYINYLSFATNLPFRINRLIRIVDWTPGLKERNCHQYEKFPGSELPHAVLDDSIFISIEKLYTLKTTPAFRRALKWFSAGISSEYTDDQFQFFWLTVELIAQLTKQPEKVNDLCTVCHQPLYCQSCNTHPKHKPYAKQAIKQLFERTMRDGADKFFETSNGIRNAIMHGEEVEAIEASSGHKLEDIVNTLGGLAWTALLNTFLQNPEDRERISRLNLLQTNMYAHQVLTTAVHLLVYSSDPNNPKVSEFAKPKISLVFNGSEKET